MHPLRTHNQRGKGRQGKQYPTGHIAHVQETCQYDKRGKETTIAVARALAYSDFLPAETVKTHIVPRESITRSQVLAVSGGAPTEVMDLRRVQYLKDKDGKLTGERVLTTDQVVLKRSTKTLLRGQLFDFDMKDVRRLTSRSKLRHPDKEHFELNRHEDSKLPAVSDAVYGEVFCDRPILVKAGKRRLVTKEVSQVTEDQNLQSTKAVVSSAVLDIFK